MSDTTLDQAAPAALTGYSSRTRSAVWAAWFYLWATAWVISAVVFAVKSDGWLRVSGVTVAFVMGVYNLVKHHVTMREIPKRSEVDLAIRCTDLALILSAIGHKLATWDRIRKEICVDGLRYSVETDSLGVPTLTDTIRHALRDTLLRSGVVRNN